MNRAFFLLTSFLALFFFSYIVSDITERAIAKECDRQGSFQSGDTLYVCSRTSIVP